MTNKSLKHLQLRSNNIQKLSEINLAHIFEYNSVFAILGLMDNKIGNEQVENIIDLVKLNYFIEGIELHGNFDIN
jgi:hypothetical protein